MPALVVAVGVTLVVLMHCWVTGVLGDMIVFNANFATGHVKVMSKAYSDNVSQMPNDLALLGTEEVLQNLASDYPGMEWVERIQFGGLVDAPDANGETKAQGPGGGMAVDLLSPGSKEIERLNLNKSLIRGRMIQSPEEIILSDELATKLDVEPGDQVTLISTTMYGAMSITNFTVCGTIKFGATALDRGGMVADINSIRMALDMQDATGEIFGFLPDGNYDDLQAGAIAAAFNEKFIARYKAPPGHFGAEAYAGITVIADALKRAKAPAPKNIRDALAKTSLMTVLGPVKFISYNNKSQQNKLPAFLVQWRDGQQQIVWPPEMATKKIVFPAP